MRPRFACRWVVAALAAQGAAGVGWSAPASGAGEAAGDELVDRVRFERLESGLRVCVVVEPGQPLVSVQLWFAAGSAAEPADGRGVAKELRVAREARRDAAVRVRATGAAFEGRVLRDATAFAAVTPVERLNALLPIFAELAAPLSIEDLRRTALDGAGAADHGVDVSSAEREGFGVACDAALWPAATRGELGLSQRTWSRILAALFAGHPYSHAPAPGSAAASDRVAPRAAAGRRAVAAEDEGVANRVLLRSEFDARWLVSGNATLFIVGDVDRDATLAQARESLAPLAWREPPRRAFVDRPIADTIGIDDADLPADGVVLAFLTPAWGYAENATLDVLMHRLCNPVDGVLARRLAALGAPPPRWARFAWRDAGVLLLVLRPPLDGDAGHDGATPGTRSVTRPAGDADLAALLRECLTRVGEPSASEVELRRARALAARDVREARARFRDYAWRLAAHEIIGGDLLQADFEAAHVARVAAGDLRAAAERLAETRCIVVTGRARDAGAADVTSPGAAPSEADGAAQRDADRALSPMETLRRLAAAGASDLELASPTLVTTDASERGWRLRVAAMPRASTGCVALHLPAVSAAAAARLPEAGCASRSAAELRDYFTYHGLSWRVWPALDGSTVVMDGPPERVAQMSELLAELVVRPNVDAKAIAAAERDFRRAVLAHESNAAAVADRLAMGLVAPRATASAEAIAAELARLWKTSGSGRELLVVAPGRAQEAADELLETWREPRFDGAVAIAPQPTSRSAAVAGHATPVQVGDIGSWPHPVSAARVPVVWAPRGGGAAEVRMVVRRRNGDGRNPADDAWTLLLGWPADLPPEIAAGALPRWRVVTCAPGVALVTTRVATDRVEREIADLREQLRWLNAPGDERRELLAVAGRLTRVHRAVLADGPRGALRRMRAASATGEAPPPGAPGAPEFVELGVVVVGGEASLAARLRDLGEVVEVRE